MSLVLELYSDLALNATILSYYYLPVPQFNCVILRLNVPVDANCDWVIIPHHQYHITSSYLQQVHRGGTVKIADYSLDQHIQHCALVYFT